MPIVLSSGRCMTQSSQILLNYSQVGDFTASHNASSQRRLNYNVPISCSIFRSGVSLVLNNPVCKGLLHPNCDSHVLIFQATALELLCRCDDISDEGIELRVLKGLLTAVTFFGSTCARPSSFAGRQKPATTFF